MRNSLRLTVAAACLLSAASSALAAGTWVPANVPTGGSTFTVFGINNKSVVTGAYTNSSGLIQGVVGPFDGSNYTSFSDSGSGTQPRGLNDGGTIMGFDTGTLQQWERSASGTMKNITQGGNPVAVALAQGVNKAGTFTGDYTNSSAVEVGATGTKGKYKNAFKLKVTNTGYAGRAIDTAGDVAGWYFDSSGIQHGYVNMVGATKPIKVDVPNAFYTVVEGLNDSGIVSGQWQDASGVIHGFVYDIAKKKYTSLDAPGSTFTQVWGINNSGVVAASAALSTGTGSFAYCMTSKGCPAHAGVVGTQQRPSGKAVPQPN